MRKQIPNTKVVDLGLIEYTKAYDLQKEYVNRVINGNKQYLFLCEHPAALTLGRATNRNHLLVSEEKLRLQKIETHTIDRGGDVTLHCPGQLVVYPIFNLNNYKKDLHHYLHQLEEVVIELLKDFAIVASRSELNTGVWINKKKIASIGIGVKKWVAYHGIGLNVNTPLELFRLIKPCGLDVQMTSMAEIKGQDVDMETVKDIFVKRFFQVFNLKKL